MSYCDCIGDVDLPSVWQVKKPKARTPHKCCECRGVIRPGERYEYVRGLWDGRWSTYRTCADCLHLRCEVGCSCWIYGGLADAVSGDERLNAMFTVIQDARNCEAVSDE